MAPSWPTSRKSVALSDVTSQGNCGIVKVGPGGGHTTVKLMGAEPNPMYLGGALPPAGSTLRKPSFGPSATVPLPLQPPAWPALNVQVGR